MTHRYRLLVTVVICTVTVIAMMGAAWWHMEVSRQKILEDNALAVAESFAITFESLRSLYTTDVVARVPPEHVRVTHDYRAMQNAIPLPATLTIRLAEEIGRKTDGFAVRLYSQYPFPWRKAKLDEFERDALKALAADPQSPYLEFSQVFGNRYLRYAVSDLMRPHCVSCHNTHPQSPKRDWKKGDLRGVLSISIPLRGIHASIEDSFQYLLIYFLIGGIVLISTVIWALGKR